jgi:two-component system, sensor histidine kinase PdtaS
VPKSIRMPGRVGREVTIAMLGLFGLVAVVVLSASLAWRDREDLLAAAMAQAQEQALVAAGHTAQVLEAAELAQMLIYDEISGQSWAAVGRSRAIWERTHRLAQRLATVEGFWLYDADGRLQLSSLSFPPPPTNAAGRDFFVALEATGPRQPHVGEVLSPTDDRPSFRLSNRLEWPDGRFRGVASLTIDAGYFRKFFRSVAPGHGTIISLQRPGDVRPLVRQPASNDDETTEHVHAVRPVPGFPLVIAVDTPLTGLHAAWWERIRGRALTAGLAIVALALLSLRALTQAGREQTLQRDLEKRVAERTTALAQANAKLETFFHEVHHRVKNNLQIIGSLLALQAAGVTDAGGRAALARTIGRVHTMSLVHQQLYGTGELSELAFADYLRLLAGQLADIYGATDVGIRVAGDNPCFALETAIPVALIVNEVLSVLLAHAFPGKGPGAITITIAAEGTDWHLSVIDDGVALETGHPGTDGLDIVGSLAGQVRGTARFGTLGASRFRLSFPR